MAKIVRVGVVTIRYVVFEFARPWLIHSFKNTKGRRGSAAAINNPDEDVLKLGGDLSLPAYFPMFEKKDVQKGRHGETGKKSRDSGQTMEGTQTNVAGVEKSGEVRPADGEEGVEKSGEARLTDGQKGVEKSGEVRTTDGEKGVEKSGKARPADGEKGVEKSGEVRPADVLKGVKKSGEVRPVERQRGVEKSGEASLNEGQKGVKKSGEARSTEGQKGGAGVKKSGEARPTEGQKGGAGVEKSGEARPTEGQKGGAGVEKSGEARPTEGQKGGAGVEKSGEARPTEGQKGGAGVEKSGEARPTEGQKGGAGVEKSGEARPTEGQKGGKGHMKTDKVKPAVTGMDVRGIWNTCEVKSAKKEDGNTGFPKTGKKMDTEDGVNDHLKSGKAIPTDIGEGIKGSPKAVKVKPAETGKDAIVSPKTGIVKPAEKEKDRKGSPKTGKAIPTDMEDGNFIREAAKSATVEDVNQAKEIPDSRAEAEGQSLVKDEYSENTVSVGVQGLAGASMESTQTGQRNLQGCGSSKAQGSGLNMVEVTPEIAADTMGAGVEVTATPGNSVISIVGHQEWDNGGVYQVSFVGGEQADESVNTSAPEIISSQARASPGEGSQAVCSTGVDTDQRLTSSEETGQVNVSHTGDQQLVLEWEGVKYIVSTAGDLLTTGQQTEGHEVVGVTGAGGSLVQAEEKRDRESWSIGEKEDVSGNREIKDESEEEADQEGYSLELEVEMSDIEERVSEGGTEEIEREGTTVDSGMGGTKVDPGMGGTNVDLGMGGTKVDSGMGGTKVGSGMGRVKVDSGVGGVKVHKTDTRVVGVNPERVDDTVTEFVYQANIGGVRRSEKAGQTRREEVILCGSGALEMLDDLSSSDEHDLWLQYTGQGTDTGRMTESLSPPPSPPPQSTPPQSTPPHTYTQLTLAPTRPVSVATVIDQPTGKLFPSPPPIVRLSTDSSQVPQCTPPVQPVTTVTGSVHHHTLTSAKTRESLHTPVYRGLSELTQGDNDTKESRVSSPPTALPPPSPGGTVYTPRGVRIRLPRFKATDRQPTFFYPGLPQLQAPTPALQPLICQPPQIVSITALSPALRGNRTPTKTPTTSITALSPVPRVGSNQPGEVIKSVRLDQPGEVIKSVRLDQPGEVIKSVRLDQPGEVARTVMLDQPGEVARTVRQSVRSSTGVTGPTGDMEAGGHARSEETGSSGSCGFVKQTSDLDTEVTMEGNVSVQVLSEPLVLEIESEETEGRGLVGEGTQGGVIGEGIPGEAVYIKVNHRILSMSDSEEDEPSDGQEESLVRQSKAADRQPLSSVRQPQSTVRQTESIVRQPQVTIRQPMSTVNQPLSLVRQPQSTVRHPGPKLDVPSSGSPVYSKPGDKVKVMTLDEARKLGLKASSGQVSSLSSGQLQSGETSVVQTSTGYLAMHGNQPQTPHKGGQDVTSTAKTLLSLSESQPSTSSKSSSMGAPSAQPKKRKKQSITSPDAPKIIRIMPVFLQKPAASSTETKQLVTESVVNPSGQLQTLYLDPSHKPGQIRPVAPPQLTSNMAGKVSGVRQGRSRITAMAVGQSATVSGGASKVKAPKRMGKHTAGGPVQGQRGASSSQSPGHAIQQEASIKQHLDQLKSEVIKERQSGSGRERWTHKNKESFSKSDESVLAILARFRIDKEKGLDSGQSVKDSTKHTTDLPQTDGPPESKRQKQTVKSSTASVTATDVQDKRSIAKMSKSGTSSKFHGSEGGEITEGGPGVTRGESPGNRPVTGREVQLGVGMESKGVGLDYQSPVGEGPESRGVNKDCPNSATMDCDEVVVVGRSGSQTQPKTQPSVVLTGEHITETLGDAVSTSKERDPSSDPTASTSKEGQEGGKTRVHFVSGKQNHRPGRGRKTVTPDTQPTGTYERVRVIPRPWKTPEGTVNRPVLRMMTEGVLLHIMCKPGISLQSLFDKYNLILQPVLVRELVELLQEVGCVSLTHLKVNQQKPDLLSARKTTLKSSITESSDQGTVVMPTIDCILKMGQFQCQVGHGH